MYVTKPINLVCKRCITMFRLLEHYVHIEMSLHSGIARNMKYEDVNCSLNGIVDEYHFIFMCPFFYIKK